MNIDKAINNLAKDRPLFHSEADFQFALAWEIQKLHPRANIRLEMNLNEAEYKSEYLDALVKLGGKEYGIELKYKTRGFRTTVSKEPFVLKDQRAHDVGRYDFIKDITRLERFTKRKRNRSGIAILVTNDGHYWNESKRATVDSEFRLHDGRKLEGRLSWSSKASEGTRRGREEPLILRKSYNLKWMNYSSLEKGDHFKYLKITI